MDEAEEKYDRTDEVSRMFRIRPDEQIGREQNQPRYCRPAEEPDDELPAVSQN